MNNRKGSIRSSVIMITVVLTIFISSILLYLFENSPQWIEATHQKVYNVYAVHTQTELSLFTIAENTQRSEAKAVLHLKEALASKAMEQIKISYVWETLDSKTKVLIEKSLSYILERIKFKQLSEQSIYIDIFNMKFHSLYSLSSSEFDMILHKIYEMINKVVLAELEADEEEPVEIGENMNGEYEDETAP